MKSSCERLLQQIWSSCSLPPENISVKQRFSEIFRVNRKAKLTWNALQQTDHFPFKSKRIDGMFPGQILLLNTRKKDTLKTFCNFRILITFRQNILEKNMTKDWNFQVLFNPTQQPCKWSNPNFRSASMPLTVRLIISQI